MPAAAQQKWEPTVVTTAGAGVAERVAPAAASRVPQRLTLDPSLAASPSQQRPTTQRTSRPKPYDEFDDEAFADPPRARLPAGARDEFDEPESFAASPVRAGNSTAAPHGAWGAIVTGAIGENGKPISAQSQQGVNGARTPATGAGSVAPAAPLSRTAVAPDGTAAPGAPQDATGPSEGAAPAAPDTKPESAEKGDSLDTGALGTGASAPGHERKPFDGLPPDATPVQQYCFNTTETAADARFAWQAKKIAEMEEELQKRVALLEERTQELKTWIARRDEFSQKAQSTLLSFYAKMRPDAAALQLAAMDEETAAAVLTKLDAKIASAVMGEMDPQRAARIASIISGAAKVPAPRSKPSAATAPAPASDGAEARTSPQSRTKS